MQPSVVTLTTDFGYRDHYAGVLKGVILSINPAVRIVDITHAITPYFILQGALVLAATYTFFPGGSIHLAVVDPGVGTSRRPIVVAGKNHFFVGPDNGLFTRVYQTLEDVTVYEISEPAYCLRPVSATFHGRDVFAPAAAHLSLGVPPARFGAQLKDYCRLPVPQPKETSTRIRGTVLYIDGYSNLITSIPRQSLERLGAAEHLSVLIRNHRIDGISPHYQAVKCGEPLAIVGSMNLLELSVREGKAAEMMQCGEGDEVIVERHP